ncbi:MAG: endonuclease/exonuclease/phosphatase family protein [Blautia marasmi]
MKLVTFNIRCDFGQDKENCFCRRRELIAAKIQKEQPDIICFQEVLPHVAVWLKEHLEGYYVIGCGRDENLRDEQVSVAYKGQGESDLHGYFLAVRQAGGAGEPLRVPEYLSQGLHRCCV